jgi:predicted DNA-binding transcriptional regulator AlpA
MMSPDTLPQLLSRRSGIHTNGGGPLLLTTEEVAELLQVSKWWVYDHGAELGRVDLGGRHRYLRERVEEWAREQSQRPERPVTSGPSRQRSGRKPARRVALLEPATDLRPDSPT